MIVLVVAAITLFLRFVPPLRGLSRSFELRTVDLRFEIRGPRPPPEHVVLIEIDESSLAALGQWPWPRATHARLIRYLNDLGAKAIVFDVLFAEPSRFGPADDQALAAALQDAGNVFLPLHNVWDERAPPGPGEPLSPLQRFLYRLPMRTATHASGPGTVLPLQILLQNAQGLGTVSAPPDADGKYRHVPLFLAQGLTVGSAGEQERLAYPHLALDVARYVLGVERRAVTVERTGEIRLGPRCRIPVKGPLEATLGFYGPGPVFPPCRTATSWLTLTLRRPACAPCSGTAWCWSAPRPPASATSLPRPSNPCAPAWRPWEP